MGVARAFTAEVVISFGLMTVVLLMSNSPRVARLTGLCAGLLVATYITIESPISGMSMNPARTTGSAVFAQIWSALWVYFTAPPIGMLLGAEVYVRARGAARVICAKLNHDTRRRCIFRCGYS
jgi:aquaporin Z